MINKLLRPLVSARFYRHCKNLRPCSLSLRDDQRISCCGDANLPVQVRRQSHRICDIGRELFPTYLCRRESPNALWIPRPHQSDASVLRQGEVPADGWLWMGCIGVTKITFLNTRNRSFYQMVTETMRDLGKDCCPSSATFEHANTITKFIQRFGTRVENESR